jgi:transposase-like protein
MYLWRAVDDEGEVLDVLVQKRRNKQAAVKLLRKLLKSQGIHPDTITTDKLASYGAAVRLLGLPAVTDQAACVRTTARKTLIWSSDDGSENSKNSNLRVQLKDFSPPTPRSTTSLIFSLT